MRFGETNITTLILSVFLMIRNFGNGLKIYILKEKSDIDESRFNNEDKGPKPVPTWK